MCQPAQLACSHSACFWASAFNMLFKFPVLPSISCSIINCTCSMAARAYRSTAGMSEYCRAGGGRGKQLLQGFLAEGP